MPRVIPAALIPIVEAPQNSPVELYELELDEGTIRFANAERDILFPDPGGNVYTALGIVRAAIETNINEQQDQFRAGLDNVNRALGRELVKVNFRGRTARIKKVFREKLDNAANFITIFEGQMDEPTTDGKTFTLRIHSRLDLVNKDGPGRIFSTQCNYLLYDEWCTQVRSDAANRVTGSVLVGSTTKVILSSALNQAVDYWIVGSLKFLDGINRSAGSRKVIASDGVSSATVQIGFPSAPDIGDTFEIIRGCNRTPDDCTNKFQNFPNYGGFNYIPRPVIPLGPLPGGGGKGGGKGGGGK